MRGAPRDGSQVGRSPARWQDAQADGQQARWTKAVASRRNFFWSGSLAGCGRPHQHLEFTAVHPPRPPALNHTVTSALWAIGLGAFIWIGLISVEVVSRLSSLVFGIVGGVLIFFFVLLFGQDEPRARRQPRAKH